MYALESVAAWAPGSSGSSFECRGRRSGGEGKQGGCLVPVLGLGCGCWYLGVDRGLGWGEVPKDASGDVYFMFLGGVVVVASVCLFQGKGGKRVC